MKAKRVLERVFHGFIYLFILIAFGAAIVGWLK